MASPGVKLVSWSTDRMKQTASARRWRARRWAATPHL